MKSSAAHQHKDYLFHLPVSQTSISTSISPPPMLLRIAMFAISFCSVVDCARAQIHSRHRLGSQTHRTVASCDIMCAGRNDPPESPLFPGDIRPRGNLAMLGTPTPQPLYYVPRLVPRVWFESARLQTWSGYPVDPRTRYIPTYQRAFKHLYPEDGHLRESV